MEKKDALDLAKKYVNLDNVESCIVTSNGDVYVDKKASELEGLYAGRDVEFIVVKGSEESEPETTTEETTEEAEKPKRNKRNGTIEGNDQ